MPYFRRFLLSWECLILPLVVPSSHAWYAETLKERVPQDVNLAVHFPYAYRLLVERRQPFIVHSYDDVPSDAAVDRASHLAMGVRSTLAIPITVGSELRYVMIIDAMSQEVRWPQSYVPRLQLLGEIFANAVERKRISDDLRQSEARLALATASAGAGPWDLDMSTGRIWATPAAKALYGFARDLEVTFDMFLGVVHPEDVERVRDRVRSGKRVVPPFRQRPFGSTFFVMQHSRLVSSQVPGELLRLVQTEDRWTERS